MTFFDIDVILASRIESGCLGFHQPHGALHNPAPSAAHLSSPKPCTVKPGRFSNGYDFHGLCSFSARSSRKPRHRMRSTGHNPSPAAIAKMAKVTSLI